ncbi:MAG: alpha-ketoglutarate-dependent dioxygenase AlkB [Gammaproteobacteria bacterium]|nr:alpha-ketoglutarate-dependent dioxygenase AlkB [Gammaproteobacteria bacterium]
MTRSEVAPEVVLLHGFAAPIDELDAAVECISAAARFRQLKTPSGRPMSAFMTSCGACGWYSDARGYRYELADPLTGQPWPDIPPAFAALARTAATTAGFGTFDPDTCLINRYSPTAQMGAHRDADERDFSQPIVSVTLGAAATFLWYGLERRGSPVRIRLFPGDVLVWGGAARKGYHAVQKPEGGTRYNLTFRKAL